MKKEIFTNIISSIKNIFIWSVLLSSIFIYGQQDSLQYPFQNQNGGLYLSSPLKYEASFDPATGYYILTQKIGNISVGEPIWLTQDEYFKILLSNSMESYYMEKSKALDTQYRDIRYGKGNKKDETNSGGLVLPSLKVKNKLFKSIFGGDKIELIPKGYVSLDLGVLYQNLENPQMLPQNRTSFAVDMQQRIQMSVLGKVGENLQLEANYDTQAGFGFENRMNLGWRPKGKGGEDDIIQNIEFGNVSMPLSTSLITGAQSLFGAKGEFKFGNTNITTLFSQQESEARNITVQGGGLLNTFKIYAKDYEINQHYFLAQYFREKYDGALANYPVISSQINITRLEVWVIDRGNSNQANRRSMLALRDIGDQNTIPENGALYNQVFNLAGIREANTAESAIRGAGLTDTNGTPYSAGEHFMIHENVRLLTPSEYTFYPSLGYISLNQPLNDNELLGVSFQYTLTSQPGKAYSVGEFSDQQSKLLITKLLKSNANVNVKSPMWNLMMKNIYSLETMQLSKEDFRLNIFYQDPAVGSGALNYLQNTKVEDKTLLQVLNMDRLDMNGQVQISGEKTGDGLFDFVPGITIDTKNGKIIFTTIEPFAKTVANQIGTSDSEYVLNNLYTELPISFEQDASVKRYFMEGQYKSEGGDGIPLGAFNVPKGSVKVTANGRELVEGVDYMVDYQLGRVQIINQMLKDSGTPINISLENRSAFNMQTKRLMGLNVEHKFSDEFLIGATYMNYKEKMIGASQKSQYNAEPVSNSIFGANIMYNSASEWLTRMTDKIPLVNTDAPSQISFKAEGAYLIPGVNSSTKNQSYIDDFEDSQSRISLMDIGSWHLASTPISDSQNPNPDFDATKFNPDDYSLNYYRRGLSWYNIDPRFYQNNSPLSKADLSNHASRKVNLTELFSSRDITAGTQSFNTTFDLTYFPEERGPYNLNPDWENESKDDKWAGITRALTVTNLKQTNVEYVEFWLMDPYADGASNSNQAKLMMHLGNVSEDILRDGNLLYENGINQEGKEEEISIWGKQPKESPILYSFQTEGDERRRQDVGLDGLIDAEEALHEGYKNFATYTNPVTNEIDPAADNFVYYMDDKWKNNPKGNFLPNRYRFNNGPEANSPSNSMEAGSAGPDTEDVNNDYNLDRIENYNQYTIKLDKSSLNLDNPFIVDSKKVNVQFENNQAGESTWYLFRVPVSNYDQSVGAASDNVLTSARFMRLILKGFETQTTLRFASFDMVRSDWRRYSKNIYPKVNVPEGDEEVNQDNFSIGSVNIEENSTSNPPYVVPPGVERERYQTNTGPQNQNEASMVMNLSTLEGGDARAVFKNTNLDLRRYKNIKMFSHVHAGDNGIDASGQLKLFVRIGSDLSNNYYEYEMPLYYTPKGANSITSIWPEDNMMDINTDDLISAKKEAYKANNLKRFEYIVDEKKEKHIYVKGRPSLGNVSTVMIGIRNTGNSIINDAIIWVNELRLSDVDNKGGYAANASLNLVLGDLAQINTSGSISTVGFGALDRGPVERQQEEMKEYNINTAVNLDKFTPEKWGLKIPLNYTISEKFIDPKYNPLDNDIEFDEDPRREQLKEVIRTYHKTTTIALNNIRKERSGNKEARFYDVENLSASFLYTSDYFRDIYTSYRKRKDLKASLNYNYNFKSKYIEPFKDWHMVNDTAKSMEYLKWIKEFNINPKPSRISFRADILRNYNEQQYRDLNSYLVSGGSPVQFNPVFSRNFMFNWQYNIGFDLTKSLRIDFNSATQTLTDLLLNQPDDQMVFRNIFKVGRPVNYNQNLQVNWKTPLRLLPYLEWADVELGYSAKYDWRARLTNEIIVDGNTQNIGNLAQNSQTITAVGNLDFSKLYDKFSVFERLETLKQARKKELDSINRNFQNLTKNKNGLKKIRKTKIKIKNKFKVTDYILMIAQSIKRGQFNFNKISGIVLPGILAEPNFIGHGKNGMGPGTGFIFGSQFDIRRMAVENGWITNSNYLTEPYTSNINETLTANIQVEPSPSLRIDFNAKRNLNTITSQSGFGIITETNTYGFESAFQNIQENFTISTLTLGTAFKNPENLYQTLKSNAQQISIRMGHNWYGLEDTSGNGYAQGLGITNADVLVPAFLATYKGTSAPKSNFDYKRFLPLPNWNLNYTGLMNIPLFTKIFDKFELTHTYLSTYTVSGVQNNLNRYAANIIHDVNGNIETDSNGNPISGLDGNQNLMSTKTYGAVSIVESFSPMIGVDLTLRNSMQLRAQYNKDRIISLSLSNYTLTENYGNELIVGLGYIIKDVKMSMRYMGKKKTIKGDLTLRTDLSIRDDQTRIRRILDDDSQITGGQNLFSLRLNAQYSLSKNLNISLFYDQMMTKYKISTAFPLSTIRAGINATFTFGN